MMKKILSFIAAVAVAASSFLTSASEPTETAPKLDFTWGAGAGASIDVSANDMSAIDFDIAFGMRRGWINFLGVGAQADIMVSNSCRSYPFFVLFRTDFSNTFKRVFWEAKGGLALNYLENNNHQTGGFANTGIGIRLASGAKFSSHLVVGYTWMQRKDIITDEHAKSMHDLHYASVKLGITF